MKSSHDVALVVDGARLAGLGDGQVAGWLVQTENGCRENAGLPGNESDSFAFAISHESHHKQIHPTVSPDRHVLLLYAMLTLLKGSYDDRDPNDIRAFCQRFLWPIVTSGNLLMMS
jgi:hypothetical protein